MYEPRAAVLRPSPSATVTVTVTTTWAAHYIKNECLDSSSGTGRLFLGGPFLQLRGFPLGRQPLQSAIRYTQSAKQAPPPLEYRYAWAFFQRGGTPKRLPSPPLPKVTNIGSYVPSAQQEKVSWTARWLQITAWVSHHLFPRSLFLSSSVNPDYNHHIYLLTLEPDSGSGHIALFNCRIQRPDDPLPTRPAAVPAAAAAAARKALLGCLTRANDFGPSSAPPHTQPASRLASPFARFLGIKAVHSPLDRNLHKLSPCWSRGPEQGQWTRPTPMDTRDRGPLPRISFPSMFRPRHRCTLFNLEAPYHKCHAARLQSTPLARRQALRLLLRIELLRTQIFADPLQAVRVEPVLNLPAM